MRLLAVDLGASHGRVILAQLQGEQLRLQEIHTFPNGPELLAGSLYWNLPRLFAEIGRGVRRAQAMVGKLDSIAVDAWGVDYGLLDAQGNLLTNAYHYRDARTNGMLEEVYAKISKEDLYARLGIQSLQINTLFQLCADQKYRPQILAEASSLVFIPDLINYWLTGIIKTEHTIASTSQLYSPKEQDWVEDVFTSLDLPFDLMQDLVSPGVLLGKILPQVSKEWGVSPNINVVTVGSHDTASAVAACPLEENSAYISCGTWSLLGVELQEPLVSQQACALGFTNEVGLENSIRFLKNISGMWILERCKESWAKAGTPLSYAEITAAAKAAPAFQFRINPNDPSFLNPPNMPLAIRDYCQAHGQAVPETWGEMARGIYESLAFSYQEGIRDVEKLTDKPIQAIHLVGGGSQAGLLWELTQEVTGKKVTAGPVEATAYGNVLGQLLAHGEVKSLAEGRALVRRSAEIKEYGGSDFG